MLLSLFVRSPFLRVQPSLQKRTFWIIGVGLATSDALPVVRPTMSKALKRNWREIGTSNRTQIVSNAVTCFLHSINYQYFLHMSQQSVGKIYSTLKVALPEFDAYLSRGIWNVIYITLHHWCIVTHWPVFFSSGYYCNTVSFELLWALSLTSHFHLILTLLLVAAAGALL